MRQRFSDATFAYQDSPESVVRRERIPLNLQRPAQMALRRVEITIVSAYYAKHQTSGVVVRFFQNRTFEITTSQHRLIEAEEMLADEECDGNVSRVQHERFLKVANAALGVAFDEEVRAGVQQSCKEIEVVAAEASEHLLYALVELLLLGNLFVVLRDPVTP